MAGIVLTGSILVGSGIGIGYLFNRNQQAKGVASSGQAVEALKTASPISQNTNNKIDITSLMESDGARGLKILVPMGWTFETSDGGGSGASSSWKDPSNPERNVFVARGMQIGAWYGLDGVDGSIDPKGLLPSGAKIVRLNQFTFGYQVHIKNSDLVTDGVWQAEINNQKANPDAKKAMLESGINYNANGQYKEAMAEFNKVIEMDPKNAEAYNYRGYCYILAGDFEKATADYTKAIDLDPFYADAYYNRAMVYDMHKSDHTNAICDFTKAIQLKPRFGEAYLGRGAAYAKDGKSDAAINDYNKAIEIDPENGNIYYNRAVTYYAKGEYQKSWDNVGKAQELGCEIHPVFLKNLKKASGREN